MKKENYNKTNSLKAIHLHLELTHEYLDTEEKMFLRRYGESLTGDSIIRDILIPSDMPLHNLHYAIQKLFGWQNSHLRRFILPKEVYSKLTGGTVKGWTELVGILFQPPIEGERDIFWDDDYRSGNFKAWLKKKYTGPYIFKGTIENYKAAQEDIKQLIDHFPMLEVKESFGDYMNRSDKGDNKPLATIKIAPLIELTIDEMNNSICLEAGTENLLERIEVSKLLAFKEDELADNSEIFPVTHKLVYNYDFGDDWIVNITKEKDCKELLKKGYILEEELSEAETIVLEEHKPVCIHKEGLFVLDDVGGLTGYARFLGKIYEGEDKEEVQSYKSWAKSLGWSDKKVSNKSIL